MATGLKICTLLGAFFLLSACTSEEISAPSCRVNAQHYSDYKAPGSCLINLNDNLLVLTTHSGKYDLPYRQNLSTESAQCAAHRSVWELTGFNVEVGQSLGRLNDEKNIWVYECTLDVGFDGSESELPVPDWAIGEVQSISFVKPFEITLHEWHKPDEFLNVRNAFVNQQRFNLTEPSLQEAQ